MKPAKRCSTEARIELARLDERIKNLVGGIEHAERQSERNIKLASGELARRLDVLNHAHQQAEDARRETVPRETFDHRVGALDEKLASLAGDARESRGRMWLPMIVVASLAAALAVTAAKFLFR